MQERLVYGVAMVKRGSTTSSYDSCLVAVPYGDTVGAERREKHPFVLIHRVDLHVKSFLLEAST